MPTIAEACSLLGVSRPTLKKFLVRLKIEPEPHPLDQRVLLLSDTQLQTLRETLDQRPVKRTGQNSPRNALRWPLVPASSAWSIPDTAPVRPSESHYRPVQRHPVALSASQEALAANPLPAGWVARSTWSKNHGVNDRTVIRSPHMPIAEEAPDGKPWGSPPSPASHLSQAIKYAYREDQLEAAARGGCSLSGWHPCTDSMCPCQG